MLGAVNYSELRETYKNSAERGDADAQVSLALLLYSGDGGKKDKVGARNYLSKAAQSGNAEAKAYYAALLLNGEGGDADKARAISLFKEAAKAKNAWGQYNYGLHLDQEGKFRKARQYYEWATAQGVVLAKVQLAGMLAEGCGGKKDVPRALCLFREAATKGNVEGQFSAAVMLWDTEVGQPEAVMWYRKAAESGHLRAMNNYATLLLNGCGVEKNLQKALEWYQKSAEGGNLEAQFNLADIYENGTEGCPVDLKKAKEWYQKAANQGDKCSFERLKKLTIILNSL